VPTQNVYGSWIPLQDRRIEMLFGAEDDDTDESEEEQDSDDSDTEDENAKTFDEKYVTGLRKENASYRTRAKEETDKVVKLQKQLDAIKRKEMSELEASADELTKANERIEELETSTTTLGAQLMESRLQAAVFSEAVELNFNDPDDALSMIPQDDLFDDDGNTNRKQIKQTLKRLADKKPYLLKVPGKSSGDGGAKGDAPDDGTWEGKVKKWGDHFADRGRI